MRPTDPYAAIVPEEIPTEPKRAALETERDKLELARRYVWWQPPEQTLEDLGHLLCQIMNLGTARDYVAARRLWGEQSFRAALLNAQPGAMSERSWHFWHLHFGIPERPMPKRRFAS